MADRVGIVIELIGKEAAISGLQQLQGLVNQLNGKSAKVNVDTGGVSRAQSAVSNLFTTVGSVSKGIGGMLTTTSSVMSRTGGMLNRIGGLFGGNVLRKASWYTIGAGLRLMSDGLNDTITRFDTMRTFPKLMETIGISTEKSADIVENKLNKAVLGLPTALNEIVDTTKYLTMLYGDIDKGSDLAIAANNAFLAAGSDATQVYYGMKQIRDILAKGSLRTMEWDSLFAALGTSTQVVGEAMGYSADRVGEFQTALREGDIEARKFLDALIEVGATEDSELWKRASISKDTISSRLKNVKNAFSILGKEALEAFDTALEENTGAGLPDQILKISDAIKNQLSPAVSGWVEDNADNIIGFFKKLQSFNWGKLANAVVDNAGQVLDFFGGIAGKIGEDNIIKFVAFATTWASPLGKALQLLASPIGIAGTLFSKFGRMMTKAGKFIGKGGGLLGKGAAGAAGASGFKEAFAFLGEIAAVGGLIAEFAKVAEVVAKADLTGFEENIGTVARLFAEGGAFSLLLTSLGTMASKYGMGANVLAGEGLTLGMEGLIAGVGGLLTEFTHVAQQISDAKLDNFETNMEKLSSFMNKVALMVGGTTTGFGVLTGATGGIGGVLAALAMGLEGLSLDTIRRSGNLISQFVGIAEEVNEADFPTTAKIDRMGSIVRSLSDAFTSNIDIDKGTVESVNNALEAVKAISRDLYAFENISDTDVDLKGASEKIGEIVTTLGEISSTMYKEFPETGWESNEQAKIMGNMLSVIDNINQTIPIFQEIQKTIDSIGAEGVTQETGTFTAAGVTTVNREYIRDKFQGTIDQIDEIIAGMRDISNQITPSATIIGALHERIKSSIQDNIIKNYSATMAQINGLAAAIGETDVASAGIGTAPQGARDLFERKKEQIGRLLDGVKDLMKDIGSKVPLIGTALKWYDSAVNKGILDNLKNSMGSIRDIMVKTNLAMSTMNRIDLDEMPGFKDKVTSFMSSIKEVTNAFSVEGFSQNAADSGVDYGVMATNLENIALAMGSVKEMMAQISSMEGDLESVLGRGRNGSTMSQLSEAIQGLQIAFDNVPEDTEDISARVEGLKTAMDSVKGIIDTMVGMYENIGVLQGDGTVEQMGSIISSIVTALTGSEDVEAATAQIQAISDFIANLNTNLDTLSSVDFSTLIESSGELQSAMEQLQGALDNVYSSLQNVSRGAIEANTAINNLANTAQNRAGAFGSFIGALGSLSGALGGAAGQASALASAINSIPTSRTVTVTYNQVGSPGPASVGSGVGGGGGGAWATGGLIPQYRAFGGTIFAMRPKGSDTVPAMLTPGEFVLRKKAVDTLGVPFLRALNALNIPGAIDRLMSGIRTPAGFGVVSNDNRRIYNNNQKVNQNIYTNNPSYANRRANRWAKSL